MTLADRIIKRREALGISQAELGSMLGYKDRSTINKIEKGRPISQKIIVRIADALKTTPAYLMGWVDENGVEIDTLPFNATNDAELLGLFHQLSPDQQDSVLNLIKSMIK